MGGLPNEESTGSSSSYDEQDNLEKIATAPELETNANAINRVPQGEVVQFDENNPYTWSPAKMPKTPKPTIPTRSVAQTPTVQTPVSQTPVSQDSSQSDEDDDHDCCNNSCCDNSCCENSCCDNSCCSSCNLDNIHEYRHCCYWCSGWFTCCCENKNCGKGCLVGLGCCGITTLVILAPVLVFVIFGVIALGAGLLLGSACCCCFCCCQAFDDDWQEARLKNLLSCCMWTCPLCIPRSVYNDFENGKESTCCNWYSFCKCICCNSDNNH
jgi:hypothetical protein